MKLITAGVTFSAAIVRSPSFSRSASSTTITMRPARISSIASSIRANGVFGPAISRTGRPFGRCALVSPARSPAVRPRGFTLFFMSVCHFPRFYGGQRQARELRGANDVLADHVAFEVDAIAGLDAAQVRVLHGERHELHVEPIGAQAGDGEADAVHGDRAFVYEKGREAWRKTDGEPVKLGVLAQLLHVADGVHVSLHEVSAESAVGAQRPFQVHRASGFEPAERRHARR